MHGRLDSRIAVIACRAQGIGAAIAKEFTNEGAKVAIIDTALFRAFPDEWKSKKHSEVPLGRLGTPDEIAPTAVMLASDDGSYHVGATLNPNGSDEMI